MVDLRTSYIGPDYVICKWKFPLYHQHFGVVEGFRYELYHLGSLIRQGTTLDIHNRTLKIEDLPPCPYVYSLKIAPFNEAGVGPYTEHHDLVQRRYGMNMK